MTDRELLELAAKAAGIDHYIWVDYVLDYDSPHYRQAAIQKGSSADTWNPLTDDGDALRLAVKLKFDICHDNNDTDKSGEQIEHVNVWPFNGGLGSSEDLQSDPYAATRRAIVRAAAEIGKGMQ